MMGLARYAVVWRRRLQAWWDRASGFGSPLRGYPGGTYGIAISSRDPWLHWRADLVTQSKTRWSLPPPSHMPASAVISALARSLLAGDPFVEDVQARAVRPLGRRWRWLRPLAVRYVEEFAGQ